MNDKFANRLEMFKTVRNFLNDAKWKGVWENQRPLAFGKKVAKAAAAVAGLEEFLRKQQEEILAGREKDREEDELEEAAFRLGRALVEYYNDLEKEADASKFDRPRSAWTRLRDLALLGKAREVREAVEALAADAATKEAAEEYGLSAEAAAKLGKEYDDYEAIVSLPRQSAATRAGLTKQLKDRTNAVAEKFDSLDNLIEQFEERPEGRNFIAAYKKARVIVDRGAGPAEEAPIVTPAA